MKKLLLISLSTIVFSCSTTNFYQISKTVSNDTPLGIFEDANCKITYDFWSEGGNPGFVFYNKTNDPIILDLEKSFFLLNGNAFDYFQSRTFTKTDNQATAVATTISYNWLTMRQTSALSTSGFSTAFVERPSIVIPANTSKIISEFKIKDSHYFNCDLPMYPTKRQMKTINFDKTSSPYKFKNTIVYTVSGKEVVVNNSFYVSEITNFPTSEAFVNTKVSECGKNKTIKIARNAAPENFYNVYVKK